MEDLEKTIIELYQYYHRRRSDKEDVTVGGVYRKGKCDGALEALGTVYLSVYGPDKMMALWSLTMPEEE